MDISSKWIVIVVEYGEEQKYLYPSDDHLPRFFATKDEALKSAEYHCQRHQTAQVLILQVTKLVRAKSLDFEIINAVDATS